MLTHLGGWARRAWLGGGLENLAEHACTCVNYISSAEGFTVRKQQLFSAFQFQRVVWRGHENTHGCALIRAVCKKLNGYTMSSMSTGRLFFRFCILTQWLDFWKEMFLWTAINQVADAQTSMQKKEKKSVPLWKVMWNDLLRVDNDIIFNNVWYSKKTLSMIGTKNRPSSSQWSIQSLFWWLHKALQGRLSAFAASKIVN